MAEKKMTKREVLNSMLTFEGKVADNSTFVDYITNELGLLDRKNGAKKPTAKQLENEVIKEKIFEVLTKPMTATEIMIAIQLYFPDTTLTNQRISAVLRKLGDDGTQEIDKFTYKRVTYFKKVGMDAVVEAEA